MNKTSPKIQCFLQVFWFKEAKGNKKARQETYNTKGSEKHQIVKNHEKHMPKEEFIFEMHAILKCLKHYRRKMGSRKPCVSGEITFTFVK